MSLSSADHYLVRQEEEVGADTRTGSLLIALKERGEAERS